MSTKKTYRYPIFTFRWLAVHALAVPTIFFNGTPVDLVLLFYILFYVADCFSV